MKKQIGLFTAILFAVSTLMVSCSPEVHEHTFGEWEVIKEATEEAEGSKEKSCSVCEYKVTEVIAKLEHTHTFGEWKVIKEATEDAKGTKERFCTECGYKDEEIIEKLEHIHMFTDEWTCDLTYHWHECRCGEKQDKTEHSFGEYVSNNDATILDDGTKTRTCKICDYAEKVTDNGTKIVYNVGDIILKDGTKISVDDVDACLFDATKAVGVVALINIVNGVPKPKIIGIATSNANWTPEETTGYTTNFTEIQSNYSGSAATGYAFTGDLDGSNNWDYISISDSDGAQNAEINYPIFYLANIYGSVEPLGLTGTDYEIGWYIPSIAELYKVYKNKEIIQRSLSAAGGFKLGIASYWSSSQGKRSENALCCDFDDGYVSQKSKHDEYRVFVLHDLVIK